MTNPATPDHVPPLLVGREREQAVLRDHLAAALAGHGGLMLIGGEAGIGKTALAEVLCRGSVEHGALVLVGRCYDLSETPPYGPWVDLFGGYRPGDGMLALPDGFAQRGTVGEMGSQATLFEQVLGFFSSLARARPVVLLLEDLHWADTDSLDLLRFIARNLATLTTLVVATYRGDEVASPHPLYHLIPLLVREAGAVRLDLHPLDENVSAHLFPSVTISPMPTPSALWRTCTGARKATRSSPANSSAPSRKPATCGTTGRRGDWPPSPRSSSPHCSGR